MAYKPIESYGVIGDLHTVALVGMDGSIDWCCLPHFDSPSIFAAILDEHNGFIFLVDDVHAQFDAFVADKYGRAGDELAHFVLALAAERAVERMLGFAAADLAHLKIPTKIKTPSDL